MVPEGLRPMEWIRRILEQMANWADTADQVGESFPQDEPPNSALGGEEDFGVETYFGDLSAYK
jgi:hypothetical protein